MTDNEYMQYAIELAKRGTGAVNPNPMVGAVIVRNNRIIGEGWHERYGELHAERNAIKNCKERGEDPAGASIYVTLEPCCHYGKTPPCTEAIIENGIQHVYIGSHDPNPLVAGKGVSILRNAGIKVTTNVLKEECDAINPVFFHYISTKTPYVVMKYAMTMDGKIATVTGKSQWITSEIARKRVHEDRNRYMAIMVGLGTVLADDPELTCRLPQGGRNPIRIICDTHLRTPLQSRIVSSAASVPTIIATCCADSLKQDAYIEKGCEILLLSEKDGHVNLHELMQKLGEKKIDSILLEGGAELNFSALQNHIVNHIQTYIAPKIFGGKTALAKSPIGGIGIPEIKDCIKLSKPTITMLGDDILIESEVIPCSQAL